MKNERYVYFTPNMTDALSDAMPDASFVLMSVMGYVFRGEPLEKVDDLELETKRARFLAATLEDNPRGAVTDEDDVR